MSQSVCARHFVPVLIAMSALHATTTLAQRTIVVPTDDPTIQAAIDAAQNGDTVLVAPGTYSENLNFEGKAIIVTSGAKTYADAATTIINGATDGPVVTFTTNEPATAVLNGFTVQNGHASASSGMNGGGISISNASPTITNNIIANNVGCGVFVYNSASPLIEGNDIKLSSGPGRVGGSLCNVSLAGGSAGPGTGLAIVYGGNVQVIGNTIEDNGIDSENDTNCGFGAISILLGSDILLQDNIIRNNKGCDSGVGEAITTPAAELILIQNLIYGNTDSNGGGAQVFISGTVSPPFPSVTEINNTIYGGTYGQSQEFVLSFAPSTVANNIFMTAIPGQPNENVSSLSCADPEAQDSPLGMVNNDVFNPGTPGLSYCPLGNGNLSVDPLFRNPPSDNFHLQPSSPVIAAGDLNAPDIPSTDLGGKARIVCDTIDMGAYEFHPHPPTALSSSNNPAQGGRSVTFTAQLTGNCNVPTGLVTFLDGSTSLGTGTLDGSGTVTFTTSFLVVGQHNITASYPGDFNFGKNTSSILVQTVIGDPTATTIAVSPNPAIAFSPITLSSVVTSPYVTPNGTVVFTADAETLATATLDASGRASATISTLGGGSYSITANYQATTLFHASSSAPFEETVLGADTATTLTASPNPATITQAVTLTAVVRDTQGSTVPIGNVAFMNGTATLGTAALNASGIATLTASTLAAGTQVITANYAGSASFNPSSATVSETIALIGTSLALATSPNPANSGETITLTATATAMLAGLVPPGIVTFYDGGSVLGTASLGLNGTATFSTSSLGIGTHPLTAMLTTGADFSGSTSPVVNEVVQAYDFALALSRTTVGIPSGDYSNITVTVSPIGGFVGAVSLGCEGVPDHAQCVFPQGSTVSLVDGAKTVTLAINTSDVYGYGKLVSRSTWPANRGRHGEPLIAILLPALGFLGLSQRRQRLVHFVLIVWIVVGLIAVMLCLQSCSGKLPGKTLPGTYALTVVGTNTSGSSLQHSVPVQLIVTP